MRGRGGGNNINGGGRGGGGPPADLLVCFPARARLALMPKPVCSPSRSAADVAPKRRQYPSSRSATRGQVASPLFRFKTRDTVRAAPALLAKDDVDISEPTSPKVTCAGQIKVSRPKTSKLPASGASSGANKQSWLSVDMEELRRHQRRHGIRGHSSSWLDALGLKKEAVHLLHGLRLRMRCFGSFRDIVREDDQDDSSGAAGEGEEEEEEEEDVEEEDLDELEGKQGDAHRTIFSKWFMLLQEESPRDQGSLKKKAIYKDELDPLEAWEEEDQIEGAVGGCLKYVTPSSPCASCSTPAVVLQAPPPPPPNALLLMRCRSSPSKGCRPDIGAGGADGTTAGGAQGDHGRVTITTSAKKKRREDIEKEKDQERLMLMISYAPDLFKVSPDIAKETWLVGSFDPLLRSRSWKT